MIRKGYFAHECPEWDYLTIDECCYEIMCCECFDDKALNLIKEGYQIINYDYSNEANND